jgi:hypothetical protein
MVFSVRSGIGMKRRFFSKVLERITKLKLSIAFRLKRQLAYTGRANLLIYAEALMCRLLGS